MPKTNYVYCDSCVFLAYLKEETGRVKLIEQLFEEIQHNPDSKILTSVISITEVAHIAEEKDRHKLASDSEEQLDEFWANSSLLNFIEVHEAIARETRSLIRYAISLGHSLKLPDAIHLTSAKYTGVSEFFTYDKRLVKFSAKMSFDIVEPYVNQPRLPLE